MVNFAFGAFSLDRLAKKSSNLRERGAVGSVLLVPWLLVVWLLLWRVAKE